MASPRTDGLYINVSEDGRDYFRFFDDGTVVNAATGLKEPPAKVLEWLVPKASSGNKLGNLPAPVTLTKDRIRFTLHQATTQFTYEGTWSKDRLVVDLVSTEGVRLLGTTYTFVSAKDIGTGDKKALAHLQPKPADPPPPRTPPKTAKKTTWGHWIALAKGDGPKLTSKHRVTVQSIEWTDDGPNWNSVTLSLGSQLYAKTVENVGDSVRAWIQEGNGVRVTDFTILQARLDAPEPPTEGGVFVGPVLDGRCMVIRFVRFTPSFPLVVVAAYVAANKVSSMLGATRGVSGVFTTQAPVTVDGAKIRWMSQTLLGEQIEFEGTWSKAELVLNQRHAGPEATSTEQKNVHYTFKTEPEVAAMKGGAAKAPAKPAPKPVAKPKKKAATRR